MTFLEKDQDFDKMNIVQNIKDLKDSVSKNLKKNIQKFVEKNKNVKIEEGFSSISSPFCSTEAFCDMNNMTNSIFGSKNKVLVNDILDFRDKTNNTSFEKKKVEKKDCDCNKTIEGFEDSDQLIKNEMKNHSDKNFKRYEFDFYLYLAATGVAILSASLLSKY